MSDAVASVLITKAEVCDAGAGANALGAAAVAASGAAGGLWSGSTVHARTVWSSEPLRSVIAGSEFPRLLPAASAADSPLAAASPPLRPAHTRERTRPACPRSVRSRCSCRAVAGAPAGTPDASDTPYTCGMAVALHVSCAEDASARTLYGSSRQGAMRVTRAPRSRMAGNEVTKLQADMAVNVLGTPG